MIIIITVNLYSAFLEETSNALRCIFWTRNSALNIRSHWNPPWRRSALSEWSRSVMKCETLTYLLSYSLKRTDNVVCTIHQYEAETTTKWRHRTMNRHRDNDDNDTTTTKRRQRDETVTTTTVCFKQLIIRIDVRICATCWRLCWMVAMVVFCSLIICPIAIAFSKGQIIKSVCVCLSVCLSLYVSVCGHSHGRISWSIFTIIGTDVRILKSKNEFVGVNIVCTTPSPFCPQNSPFRSRDPENPCKYLVILHLP